MNKISPNVFAKDSPSRIIPGLRYRNAIQAIEWMCSAPGFEHRSVYLNSDGTVALAKLTFGSGMKLVGSASNQLEYAQFAAHPDKFSGREIRSISLVSWDVEGLYGRVKASGAQRPPSPAAIPRAIYGTSASAIPGWISKIKP